MKKKTKIMAGIVAFILIGGILWFANGLVGNPISKMLANKSAEKYVKETYKDMDLEISKANYNFKNGRYYVYVKSPTSIDTHFSLDISPTGKIVDDYYENNVLGKFNTWNRINSEYRSIVEDVFDSNDFPYESDISFGEIIDKRSTEPTTDNRPFVPNYGLDFNTLEIGKIYDIKELGKSAGHIVLYIDDNQVSSERASEILLDIKDILDKADVPFYTIDFTLSEKRTGNADIDRDRKTFAVSEFLYSDIYEKDLQIRLEKSAKLLQDYYDQEDAKR